MARFSSRTFRKYMSKKSRKTRRKRTRTIKRKIQKGGDTYDRSISPHAVVVNPMVWDDIREPI